MVLVPQTVVDKAAVVIKFLDTPRAEVAVKSPPRFDHSTVETEVL